MHKLVRRGVALGVASVGAVAVLLPDTPPGRALRRVGKRAERQVRHVRGLAKGARYRLEGRHPDPDVSDDVLTQRVRSALGPLEKHRDLPRVHVMVEDGVVLLHGELPTEDDVNEVELAAMEVWGVQSLVSFLHIGLARGTTRPSEGRTAAADRPSEQMHALLLAAHDVGVPDDRTRLAVRAVLSAFTERIPEDERRHLFSHLPSDVHALAEPPRRAGGTVRVRSVPELVSSVSAHGYVDPGHIDALVESVLGQLRAFVPEEAADIAAVLPEDLRMLWEHSVPG